VTAPDGRGGGPEGVLPANLSVQLRDTYEHALRGFRAADPEVMAVRSGADLVGARLLLPYLGLTLSVAWPSGRIEAPPGWQLDHEDRILAWQYLAGAQPRPVEYRWASFNDLPGGPHHYDLFQELAVDLVARTFGPSPGLLSAAAGRLGGVPLEGGDAQALLWVYPRVPLQITVWRGDDEFPHRAAVVFDAASAAHLATASLYVLGINVCHRLRREAGQADGPGGDDGGGDADAGICGRQRR